MKDEELSELLDIAKQQLTNSLEQRNPDAAMGYALASIAASQFIIAERTVNIPRNKKTISKKKK